MPGKWPVRYFSITVLLWLYLPVGFAQNGNWLDVKLKAADSVILVSHYSLLSENETANGESEKPYPRLIVSGKINYRLVKERHVLTKADLQSLLRILNSVHAQTIYSEHGCFDPHHAIFIVKNEKVSSIDLCFGCERFENSADLQQLNLYEPRKWANLYNFFKKMGFKYEMKK